MLGRGELICEAREILHFYLQIHTYSDDVTVALDGDTMISGSGDNEFTNIDEVSNQMIRSADKISIVDQQFHFASAVTVVHTADEFD